MPGGDGLLLRYGAGRQVGSTGDAAVEAPLDCQIGYVLVEVSVAKVGGIDSETGLRNTPLPGDHGIHSGAATALTYESGVVEILARVWGASSPAELT